MTENGSVLFQNWNGKPSEVERAIIGLRTTRISNMEAREVAEMIKIDEFSYRLKVAYMMCKIDSAKLEEMEKKARWYQVEELLYVNGDEPKTVNVRKFDAKKGTLLQTVYVEYLNNIYEAHSEEFVEVDEGIPKEVYYITPGGYLKTLRLTIL